MENMLSMIIATFCKHSGIAKLWKECKSEPIAMLKILLIYMAGGSTMASQSMAIADFLYIKGSVTVIR